MTKKNNLNISKPNMKNKKSEIIKSLKRRKIKFTKNMTKKELLELIEKNQKQQNSEKIHDINMKKINSEAQKQLQKLFDESLDKPIKNLKKSVEEKLVNKIEDKMEDVIRPLQKDISDSKEKYSEFVEKIVSIVEKSKKTIKNINEIRSKILNSNKELKNNVDQLITTFSDDIKEDINRLTPKIDNNTQRLENLSDITVSKLEKIEANIDKKSDEFKRTLKDIRKGHSDNLNKMNNYVDSISNAIHDHNEKVISKYEFFKNQSSERHNEIHAEIENLNDKLKLSEDLFDKKNNNIKWLLVITGSVEIIILILVLIVAF